MSLGATALPDLLPERIRRGIENLHALARSGIHFAPIRHHSPACAGAVQALIDEVRPAAVLIEGPEEFTTLLPALQHDGARPPIAVLSRGDARGASGFFPFAAFSPEWVALRAADAQGAGCAFIDLPWSDRPDEKDDVVARPILSEAALARSRTLAALARREHCRDTDELWEHLFELRPLDERADHRALFTDVFVWAALARLDHTVEELRNDHSLPREGRMSARIREHRTRLGPDAPIVVVTGAFHTLALVEALAGADEGAVVRAAERGAGVVSTAPAWLIRYDFTRLDALNGYASGMRSPGFQQRIWDAARAGSAGIAVTPVLVDVARAATAAGTSIRIGTSEVIAAATAAHRLAELRGHAVPGRTDLLDAITSCFVTDDSGWPPALRDAVADVFGGGLLGELPPGTAAPPLVAEARERARAERLSVGDSSPRRTSIDRLRSPGHRRKARFLALMSFLGTGFSRRIGGTDVVSGRGDGRLFEEWEYAWTPMVEAELIRLAETAGTLEEQAAARIEAMVTDLDDSAARAPRSAVGAVEILAHALVIGLADLLPRLVLLVRSHLDDDASTASVVAAATRLLALRRAHAELDADTGPIDVLLDHAMAALGYLLPAVGDLPAAVDDSAVAAILDAHDLISDLDAARDEGVEVDTAVGRRILAELTAARSPAVSGAALALGAIGGEVGAFEEAVAAQLGTGADVERSVRFLGGVLHAAPDLIVRDGELRAAVDAALTRLDGDAFLAFLPDLRRAFGRLKPSETALLAERLAAEDRGDAASRLAVHHSAVGRADLAQGVALERALRESLAADGLLGLFA